MEKGFGAPPSSNPISQSKIPTPPRPPLGLSKSGKSFIVSSPRKSFRLSNPNKHIDKKTYVNQVTGRHKDTELHLAAQRGDVAVIKHILGEINARTWEITSAIVNVVNELGETALFPAVERGHLDFVKELLPYVTKEGLSIKNRCGFNVLHVAASKGHQEIVQVLLDYDPGLIKTVDNSNATPLIFAATRGHANVVEQLLSYDPTLLESPRCNGKNALHFAARQGHVDVVRILLQKDPKLAWRADKKGQTALHMAVKGTNCEVVKWILGIDAAILMMPDKFGNTALHVATRKKRAEIVNELLLLPDINVNALTREHKTALDIADGLLPFEETLEIKNCLLRYDAVRANDLNQPRDELRKTMRQIKSDVSCQLEQTRKTNKNIDGIAKELRKLHEAGVHNATNSVTAVAVLFAIVAFAAIFRVPLGDDENEVSIMLHTASLKIFFILNAIALFTSFAVVVAHIMLVRGATKSEIKTVEVTNELMWLTPVCTTIAFISSSYIVIGRRNIWAALLVTGIGGVIVAGVLGTMTYSMVKSYRTEKKISKRGEYS